MFLGLVTLALLLSGSAHAGLSGPQLYSVFPPGGKQGTTVEVEFFGLHLEEPSGLFFSHPKITAELLPVDEKDKNRPRRFKVTIPPDVPVGDYDVRLICKLGISNVRTFCVSDFAEGLEQEPNDSRAQATRVNLNSTVNGCIRKGEDLDWFVFAAKAGQRILIECRAWRIDSTLDGVMWLYDSAGKELAMSQDEELRDEKRDPFIDFDVPADGDYAVKLTDFIYDGSDQLFYRLSVTANVPYVDFILPIGVPPSSNTPITFYGRNLPGGEKTDMQIEGRPLQKVVRTIAAPSGEASAELHSSDAVRPWTASLDGMDVRVKGEGGTSNAKLLLFDPLPHVSEQEPNDNQKQAQRLNVPSSVDGQFMKGDSDYYIFAAKKNEKFHLNVIASRINSPGDPEMVILDASGKALASPKDTPTHPDSVVNEANARFLTETRDIYHQFTAPEDGDYTLRIEHLFRQARGGPHFTYRLTIEGDQRPDFRLISISTHYRCIHTHMIPQGGRERVDFLCWRLRGHNEPVTIEARNLPPGVTAEPIIIAPGVTIASLVLTAAADAPPFAGQIEFVGKSKVGSQELVHTARSGEIITTNTYSTLNRLTHGVVAAVREKAAVLTTLAPAHVTVKKGQPLNLTATVTRREDLKGKMVQLHGMYYVPPPGLAIATVKVEPGTSEAKLALKTENMKAGTYSMLINADALIQDGDNQADQFYYPSNTVTVTIEEP